jgi:hypothetical protein
VPSYIISGDCDDALAKLKSTLKAQDAKFEANLQSQFKSPAAPPRPFKPAPAPTPPQKPGTAPVLTRKALAAFSAPAAKPTSTGSTTGSMLSSSRNTDDSVRGRLRTSLRSTPSR